jgi:hypothetical protein
MMSDSTYSFDSPSVSNEIVAALLKEKILRLTGGAAGVRRRGVDRLW